MNEITFVLAMIGVTFVVLCITLLPQLLKKQEQRGAAFGIIGGMGIIAAFGAGSWLASIAIWKILEAIDRTVGFGHFLAYFWLAIILPGCAVLLWRGSTKLGKHGALLLGRKRL